MQVPLREDEDRPASSLAYLIYYSENTLEYV